MDFIIRALLFIALAVPALAQPWVNTNEVPRKLHYKLPDTIVVPGIGFSDSFPVEMYYRIGWRQLVACPHVAGSNAVSWTEIDDGQTLTAVDCQYEAEVAAPQFDPAIWSDSWPLLADHPATNEIPAGGMTYRLNGDPITWWVVRLGDLQSTQISAHDDAGEPIYRSRNLVTGAERTISVGALELASRAALAPLLTNMTPAEVEKLVGVYPEWAAGAMVRVGEIYRHEGRLFRVIQTHTTQADWKPASVPALFAAIAPPQTIAPWKQPAGAHDAYKIGDKVEFQGKVYESTIDNNVWSPTAYAAGWKPVQ